MARPFNSLFLIKLCDGQDGQLPRGCGSAALGTPGTLTKQRCWVAVPTGPFDYSWSMSTRKTAPCFPDLPAILSRYRTRSSAFAIRTRGMPPDLADRSLARTLSSSKRPQHPGAFGGEDDNRLSIGLDCEDREGDPETLASIKRVLTAHGVEFIDENGGGAGVRLRKPSKKP
jgi:hypothetical protein